MKTWLFLALTAGLLGTGCARTYTVRLSTGQTLTAVTKPKRDGHGFYTFKEANGHQARVSEMRVIEIEAK
jgi:hypothetical protein